MRTEVLSNFADCIHVIDIIIVNAVGVSLIAPPFQSERLSLRVQPQAGIDCDSCTILT